MSTHPSGGAHSTAADVQFPGWKTNLSFIWVGTFVGLLGANFVFPFIPFYIQDLGVADPSKVALYTGITASVAGLSLTLTAPVWGALADRVGRKPMLLRALIGAGVSIALMGLAQTVWQLVGLRFVMGAFAGTIGASAALVAATTPRDRVGYALGTLQTAVFTANMLGPVIGGIVASTLGIRESFFFCAALFGVAAVLGLIFIKEPRSTRPTFVEGSGPRPGLMDNLRVVVAERQILLMLGMLFCLWLSTTFVRPVMPLSIDGFADHPATGEDRVPVEVFGWSADLSEEAATGIVFGVIGLTSTIAALSIAPVGQRIGYRRSVAGAAALSGLLYFPVSLADNFTTFCVFLAAVGLFQGAMVPGTNALIAARTPDGKHGSAFGLAASMQSLALLVGPLAGGITASLLGIEAVYVVIGFISLGAAFAGGLLITEPDVLRRRPSPET